LGLTRNHVPGNNGNRRKAWFALLVSGLSALLSQSVAATQSSCGLDRVHEKVVVEYVHDGDTIRLTDGRKVRLIGIDTPELGHDGEPDQPLANQAKARLTQLVMPSSELQLRYDEQRRDDYGRTLAHLFLLDGTNVQRDMLSRGLATALAVPPNLWQLECHLRAETRAQIARRGLWSLPSYQPVDADTLTKDERGFRLITGKVRRAGKGRKTVWLRLTKHVVVQIPLSDTHYFTQYSPRQLKGRRVRARGWLTPRHHGLSMTIRHPSALRILD
jgi:micrococcal nuclease